jgi:hypothetical protein
MLATLKMWVSDPISEGVAGGVNLSIHRLSEWGAQIGSYEQSRFFCGNNALGARWRVGLE